MSPPPRFVVARLAITALPLVLAACAAGERGLVPPHQPIVGPMGANVGGCPDWSDTNLPASEGQSANYGCATAINLAAMIADPADLVRGRTADGTGSGETAVRAVKALRETVPSGKGGIEKTSAKAGS